jgi:gas vesicle protein
MKLNELLKSLLKSAIYIVGKTSEQVERVSDRASRVAADAKSAIYPEEDHILRNALSFMAGIGLGVGVGILLAPASGPEVRRSIGEKMQDVGDAVRDQFSSDTASRQTGTDAG